MNDTLRLNAFQLVRPRAAVEAPAKAPRKTNHSRAPQAGNVHLALDRNGRRTVSLERRPSGITIENREQRLANEAKLARLVGGVR
jgi:hypothetical protein